MQMVTAQNLVRLHPIHDVANLVTNKPSLMQLTSNPTQRSIASIAQQTIFNWYNFSKIIVVPSMTVDFTDAMI